MIFPRQIIKTSGEGKNYLLQRSFGEEEWCIDSSCATIESISPFVVVSGGKAVTRDRYLSPGGYMYLSLVTLYQSLVNLVTSITSLF